MSAAVAEPVTGGKPEDSKPQRGFRERILAWRDRMIADPGFQRWAASFPFTRGVARNQAGDLFDLCVGFVYSQVLAACVRLDLFAFLFAHRRTVAEVADHCDLSVESAERLLRAAAALRLVVRYKVGRWGADRWGLAMRGAALMGHPGIAAMVRHHAMLYADLRDPVALLRGDAKDTELGAFWAYAKAALPAGVAESRVAEYSELMAESQPMIAGEVLGAYSMHRHHRLLDVGGGEGAFLLAVASRYPALRAQLFDLPAVAARAERRFAEAGLGERLGALGGDFLRDSLPRGADVITLVRILHDHDDPAVARLLAAAHAALPRGGTLLIAEPMAETPGAEAMGDAFFGMYLLAMGSGRPRSQAELTQMLKAAGFGKIRAHRTATPMLTRLLSAKSIN